VSFEILPRSLVRLLDDKYSENKIDSNGNFIIAGFDTKDETFNEA